jgi:ribosomal protein L37AE/L43A
MPAQLRQIIIVFVGVTVLFLLLRSFLIDDSFGKYGPYRAVALDNNKALQVKFVDQQTCSDCHAEIVDIKTQGLHDKLGCQICHGPGYLHIDTTNYTKMEIVNDRKFCGNCHNFHPARSKDAVVMIDIKEHNIDDDKCTNCHNPHQPWLNLE